MNLYLERFCDHPDHGTLGELYADGELIAYTVEQPWANNKPFNSCIPAGVYNLIPFSSPKHPNTYALFNPELNVFVEQQAELTARYACLIHPANWASNVEGCIGPGKTIGIGKDNTGNMRLMVTDSQATFKTVADLIRQHDIKTLTIAWKAH